LTINGSSRSLTSCSVVGVTASLICGKSEAILVDGQLRMNQGKKLADQIAARGRRLKAIIITHLDEDHYFGTAVRSGMPVRDPTLSLE
jgi:glyoxylase-like metal-dependent hydrolase (beta-lactamase superfamily II)